MGSPGALLKFFKGTSTNREYTVSDITDATKKTAPLPVSAIGTGQAAATASTSVVGAELAVPFTTTTAQAVGSTDAAGYRHVSVQITSQGGSSTVTFQGSNDNSNWFSVFLMFSGSAGATAPVSSTTSAFAYYGPVNFRYFRLNVTGIASGTTAGVIEFSTIAPTIMMVSLAAQSGTWNVGTLPLTTGGLSAYRNLDLGLTGQVVKASAGQLYALQVTNLAAAARYVKVYNKATAPTEADTPIFTFAVPASTVAQPANFPSGVAFAAGISLRASNAIADADTTAPTANDVVVNAGYK